MKYLLLILCFATVSCTNNSNKPNAPDVKRECKSFTVNGSAYEAVVCKFTNPNGVSFCASCYNCDSSTDISCDFFDTL